jgi:Leucine-rich repeat (LRR) protein
MTHLLYLDVTETGIADVSPLGTLTSMRVASLANNRVADISALQYWTDIRTIDLTYDSVTNLNPLIQNAGFSSGDTLRIGHNPLSSESTTSYVPILQGRGVTVLGL